MHIMISPCHVMMAHGGGMAMSPLGSETSEDVEGDKERISKIRARHYLRNRLLLTVMAADGGASATRESRKWSLEKWVTSTGCSPYGPCQR